jgi:adenylate cyclase
MAGDIAGYSRLMGIDDEGTLRQLKAHRKQLVDPKIAEHRGRIVKTTGDGILVEFVSVVDAVRCAVEIARGMSERNANVPPDQRIEFRTGINVGDIISDGNDIFGDGVNVAARLEALADPGGIMVSRVVYEQVRDKLNFGFEDMGEQTVKNIARPISVHRVSLSDNGPGAISLSGTAAKSDASDRPSIAVLPFDNISGDPEQEYFADGISEDIITGLSKLRWFFVIARNSSFAYKGKAVDIKRAARELGVRYVLEGSVRKGGNRVRITAQLIDASTGNHIWADRYDGELTDVFELQDQITRNVVAAIEPKLLEAEAVRSQARSPEDLGAWDLVMQANSVFWRMTKTDVDAAIAMLKTATERFPDYGQSSKAIAHLEQAVRMSPHDPQTFLFNVSLSIAHYLADRYSEAVAFGRKAAQQRAGFSGGHRIFAASLAQAGQIDEARAAVHQLKNLQPDISIAWIEANIPYKPEAMAKLVAGLRKAGLE